MEARRVFENSVQLAFCDDTWNDGTCCRRVARTGRIDQRDGGAGDSTIRRTGPPVTENTWRLEYSDRPGLATSRSSRCKSLGGVTVLALLTTLSSVYLLISNRRLTALYLLVSVLGGWAISSILKILVARPRPEIVPHLQEVYDLSYPSGHAMMSAVTYLTSAALLSRASQGRSTKLFLLGSAVLLTVPIGPCRLYLGVHYPTDVVAGWFAGSTWALCCWLGTRNWMLVRQEKED